MTKKWSRDRTEASLPDMQVVDRQESDGKDARRPESAVLRPGPSMEELRRKYLGTAEPTVDAIELENLQPAHEAEDDGDVVDVLRVRSKATAADPADDPGPRTIITSKNRGALGAQG